MLTNYEIIDFIFYSCFQLKYLWHFTIVSDICKFKRFILFLFAFVLFVSLFSGFMDLRCISWYDIIDLCEAPSSTYYV